ncbi:hypothetical protein BCR34DRAFT_36619 [Clohesyomyces aquaticus]|uniref:Uncharacterized protein n=1 Tax=Clohesyomyces aquaticus TaxID=1231657 RepID=A0A1Y1Z7A1_9PLEO|nr:hypothetical protein BCR34DRAFT_36619 [Clohesyomyces aquaticus]
MASHCLLPSIPRLLKQSTTLIHSYVYELKELSFVCTFSLPRLYRPSTHRPQHPSFDRPLRHRCNVHMIKETGVWNECSVDFLLYRAVPYRMCSRGGIIAPILDTFSYYFLCLRDRVGGMACGWRRGISGMQRVSLTKTSKNANGARRDAHSNSLHHNKRT